MVCIVGLVMVCVPPVGVGTMAPRRLGGAGLVNPAAQRGAGLACGAVRPEHLHVGGHIAPEVLFNSRPKSDAAYGFHVHTAVALGGGLPP